MSFNYIIVSSNAALNKSSWEFEQMRKEFQNDVNKKLNVGYELVGGMTISTTDTQLDYNQSSGGLTKFKPYVAFHQAMIKYSKHEKEFD